LPQGTYLSPLIGGAPEFDFAFKGTEMLIFFGEKLRWPPPRRC
jgi:hypothetical protein